MIIVNQSAGIFFYSKATQRSLYLLRTDSKNTSWSIPGGKIGKKETLLEGLTREYYSYANMSIYNRWGDEVYRSGSYGLDGDWWSGQSTHNNDELKEGVYFYVLNVGNKVTSEVDIYKGMVHLFK
jgi:hypothetical protein